jgi:hypothetical protein
VAIWLFALPIKLLLCTIYKKAIMLCSYSRFKPYFQFNPSCMKKICTSLAFVFCLLFTHLSNAQEAYQLGDRLISGGIGLSNYNRGYAGTRAGGFIPVFAAMEFGVHKYISVGPYLAYTNYKYEYGMFRQDRYYYQYSHNHLGIGARASFHYVPLLNEHLDFNLNANKLDFYVTLQAGLAFSSTSFRTNDPDFDENYENFRRNARSSSQYTTFGPLFGFRYMFTEKFGAFIEGGRGAFGYATLGVSGKF